MKCRSRNSNHQYNLQYRFFKDLPQTDKTGTRSMLFQGQPFSSVYNFYYVLQLCIFTGDIGSTIYTYLHRPKAFYLNSFVSLYQSHFSIFRTNNYNMLRNIWVILLLWNILLLCKSLYCKHKLVCDAQKYNICVYMYE